MFIKWFLKIFSHVYTNRFTKNGVEPYNFPIPIFMTIHFNITIISSFFILIVTRKYDTLIHSLGYGRRRCDSLSISDYSSKQNNSQRGRLFLQPSLLLQGDMGMGGLHSLFAMCASAEKQICDYDWCQGRNGQNQHVLNFQTTETS